MLFKTVDENCETSQEFKDLDKPHILQSIGIMYCEHVQKYLGKKTRFPVHEAHKDYEKQLEQIRRFVKICLKQGVPFHVYMKAQFEILVPWAKKTGKNPWVSFSMLTSDKSIKRFEDWKKKKENQYFYRKEKTKAVYNLEVPKYRSMLIKSVNALIHRLEFYLKDGVEITEEIAIKELELLTRQGKLYDIYVWSHPLVPGSGSKDLLEAKQHAEEALTKDEKEIILKIRKEVDKVAENSEKKEIARYV